MNLKWFAMGLGLGAVVAFLYTPKTGAETRQMLRDKVDDARRYATGRIQEERYTIADVLNEGREVVTGKAEAVSGAVDAAADKFSAASQEYQPEA
jgi:gas vesicle protein